MLTILLAIAASPLAAQPPNAVAARIWERVHARPDDPVSWRLLAKVLRQQGDMPGARHALERSLSLDPQSVAAHFDLGMLLLDLGVQDGALFHLDQAAQLAPGSEQSQAAAEHAARLRGEPSPAVELASFAPRWAEPPQPVEEVIDPPRSWPWTVRIETGGIFNSNVALAPISRGLDPLSDGSFQFFLSPDLEYRFYTAEGIESGLLWDSHFTLNKSDLSQFDLQHYAPGIYVAFPTCWGESQVIPRLDYEFAYDAFGGRSLGTRHALTASFSVTRPDGVWWTAYWTTDYSNFNDDGAIPEITSVDGWTHTLGAARSWLSPWEMASKLHAGANVEWAALEGDDYAYFGMMSFLAADIPLAEGLELRPELGLGFRVYPDFTQSPPRDEFIWRAGAELRRWFTEQWRMSVTFYYDRFDSRNEDFSADRITTGVTLGYEL